MNEELKRSMTRTTLLRPLLISVVQYQDKLDDGTMRVGDVIDKAHALGADGVELRRESWPAYEDELADARERAQAHGLIVTYATFSTLFNDTAAGEKWLRHDIEIARELGALQLRVFQGPAPVEAAGWDAVRAAIDHAASLGVVLALENYSQHPGATLAEIRRVLDALPSPFLKTNIDIGNYAKQGEDVVTAINAMGTRAASTHLKDLLPGGASTFLGQGTLLLPAIFDAFAGLPQRLLHCFEFSGGADPDTRITQSLAYLRERQGKL